MFGILVGMLCFLPCLIFAAPQESTYEVKENFIEEEQSAISITGVPSISAEESSEKTTSGKQIEPKTESKINTQEKFFSQKGKLLSTVPAEEVASPKEDSSTIIEKPSASQKPVVEVTTPTTVGTKKPVILAASTTKKPLRSTTVKPLIDGNPTTVSAVLPPTTPTPTRRYPCRCGGGICSCCTGLVLENFNVPIRSRACANVTYEPEDFAFNFKLLYNNRILYNTRMSAKNPRPACIPINRYFGIKMCAKLSNVYMSGRNIHACLDMEGFWDDESAFQYSFNCFRIGSNGVAVVRPEDGGGLPPPPDEEEQTDEDYDDSA